MLIHGFSFNKLNKSVMKPIIKNKKKCHSDSNNYRGIALSSILSKLLEYIIIDKIQNNLNSSDYQFAYKKKPFNNHVYFFIRSNYTILLKS